jgi:hypothetical protein
MTVGSLPWPTIEREVSHAARSYFAEHHGQQKEFIQVHFLADYLYYEANPELYPHLAGLGWQTIKTRCRMAMVRMGWEQFSQHAFKVGGKE